MSIAPRYPFGYGLSYTDFSIEAEDIKVSGSQVTLQAKVTNTGSRPGRQVVQLYLTAPKGRLKKEVQSLAAFAKTSEILPGESASAVLHFDLRDCAGFDSQRSQWILEAGEYILHLGSSSRCHTPVGVLVLDGTVVTEQVQAVCPLKETLSLLPVEEREEQALPDLPCYPIKASAFSTLTHDYTTPEPIHEEGLDRVMKKLTLQDMTNLLVGTSYVGPVHNTVFGAGGTTTSAYVKKGIPNMPMSDGPQGLNLVPRSLKPWQNLLTIPALPETLQYGAVNFFAGLAVPKENEKRTVYYQYCTAWPQETLAAQTWDVELLHAQGDAVGREMEEFGVVYWLAPGMNLHRNPLCGRNYEYYAEDPFLTGKLAAAVTRGVQSHKGCYVTLKHFACNNLECDRNKSDSILEERTLRETYLKAFRMAVQEGGARGIMASYNKVNGVYVPNNHDLLTKVLRCEWGFEGVVMTDWFASGHDGCMDELCCQAGTDLIMPGTPDVPGKLRKPLKAGTLSPEDVERSARRIVFAALHCCVTE